MEKQAKELYTKLVMYSTGLHLKKMAPHEIKEALMGNGIQEALADKLTQQGYHGYRKMVKTANMHMILGTLLLTIGLLLTFSTYSATGGTTTVLSYGAILIGVGELVVGIISRRKL
jgi:hypothetical protein